MGENTNYCSFCGKSKELVKKMLAGPDVYICDECVGLCSSIIADEHDVSMDLLRYAVPKQTAGAKLDDFGISGRDLLKAAFGVSLEGTPYADATASEVLDQFCAVINANLLTSRNAVALANEMERIQSELNELDQEYQALLKPGRARIQEIQNLLRNMIPVPQRD